MALKYPNSAQADFFVAFAHGLTISILAAGRTEHNLHVVPIHSHIGLSSSVPSIQRFLCYVSIAFPTPSAGASSHIFSVSVPPYCTTRSMSRCTLLSLIVICTTFQLACRCTKRSFAFHQHRIHVSKRLSWRFANIFALGALQTHSIWHQHHSLALYFDFGCII